MALFENFPYTNIHELNLDWIVKIAKDFLEQYTHIQQLIEDGETSLVNLKNEGLAELQEKADTLEAALQAWYDTHSEDIAQELASALADLNAWYTEHENYLDQTLQDNITAFQQRANGIGAEVIASIPSDYTDLSKRVQYLNNYTGGELIESIFGLGGWTGNVGFTRTNAHGVCITLKNNPSGEILFNSPKNVLIYDANLAFVETVFNSKTYYPDPNHKYIIIYEGTFGTTVTEAQAASWLGNMITIPLNQYVIPNKTSNKFIKAILGLGTYLSAKQWFDNTDNPYALGLELFAGHKGIIAFSEPKNFIVYNSDGTYSRGTNNSTFFIPTGNETLILLYDATYTFGTEFTSEQMFSWLDDMRILENTFTNVITPWAVPAYVNSDLELVYSNVQYGYWVTHMFHLHKDDVVNLNIRYQAPNYPVFCRMTNGVPSQQLLATSVYGELNTYYHATEDMDVCACACTYTGGNQYNPPVYTLNSAREYSRFEGKTICFIGDSYVANNGKLTSYTWEKKLCNKVGASYYNLGINGDGLVGTRAELTPVKDRLDTIPEYADVIFVIGGENDANIHYDIDSFKTGIQDIITELENSHPRAELIFCTPWGDGWNIRTYIKPYADAIKEVCNENGVKVFDGWNNYIYSKSEIARIRYYQSNNDASHLNNTGHDRMLQKMLQFLH